MLNACSECGESELAWDGFDHYQGNEGGECVCQNCGAVVAINNLTADEPGRTTAGYGQPTTAYERQAHAIRSQDPQISRGRRSGLKCTERIAQCFDCNPTMKAEAAALFERFFNHDSYRRRMSAMKQNMSACCVYIVCRRHGWPVTLTNVCAFTGGDVFELQALKNELQATFDDLADIRHPDVAELIELHCSKTNFSGLVRDSLTQIIQLCRDLWILGGRRPETVILAASYVAWQSEDPIGRANAAVSAFCKTYGGDLNHSSSRVACIAREIKSMFCQLAQQIPWVAASSINAKSIIWHVADVLKYRCSLEAGARISFHRELLCSENDDQSVGAVVDSLPQTATDNVACSAVSAAVTVDAAEVQNDHSATQSTTQQIPPLKRSLDAQCSGTGKSAGLGCDSASESMNSRAGVVSEAFLPPSRVKPRKKRRLAVEVDQRSDHPDLDSVDIGNDDIHDDDMHLYIQERPVVATTLNGHVSVD